MKKEMKKSTKIILLVVSVLALLVVLAGINKPHLSPFSTGIDTSIVTAMDKTDDARVLIDNNGRRILFLDAEDKLVNVTDVTMSGSPINRALGVSISDDKALIHGVNRQDNGIYYTSESVLKYSLNGKFIEETDRVEYQVEDNITYPTMDFADNMITESFTDSTSMDNSIHISYSAWFLIKNIAYWLSLALIVVIGVILLIKLIKKAVTKKAIAAIIGVGCILLTVVYYTVDSYNTIRSSYENEVISLTKQINVISDGIDPEKRDRLYSEFAESGEACFEDEEYLRIVDEINVKLSDYCNASRLLGDCYVRTFIPVSNSKVYLLNDSRNLFKPGSVFTITEEQYDTVLNHDINTVKYVSEPMGDTLRDYTYIYDESGKVALLVELAAYEDNILAKQSSKAVDTFVNLLAIFIGIYIVGNLIVTYAADIKRLTSRAKDDKAARSADMSGMYMFLYKMTSAFDDVITVYVAASLCTDYDPAMQAVLVALPISSLMFGRWIGTFLTTPLLQKLGDRATGLISCVGGIIGMLIMAFSIVKGDIYIYTVGKFVLGCTLCGALFVLSDGLPLNATSEEQMNAAMNSSQQSSSAAGIVTALVSGYISQYIGYSVVYIIGTILCVVLLVLTITTFGGKKSSADESEKSASTDLKACWTIFLKPEMLMYLIFYLIPVVLTGGYSTYLFPLYSASAGISVVLLSNLSVFSKTLMYITNEPLSEATKNMDSGKLLVIPQLITCAGLACLFISPNIYWAIVMLFAGGILNRMTTVEAKLYRVRIAEKYGLDSKLVSSNYYTVQSAVYVIQSPTLSAFIGLGINLGCAAVGLVSGIMFAIFGGYNRKSLKKK